MCLLNKNLMAWQGKVLLGIGVSHICAVNVFDYVISVDRILGSAHSRTQSFGTAGFVPLPPACQQAQALYPCKNDEQNGFQSVSRF